MDDLFIVALGSCTSLIFVWSFLLLLVLCPSGTHERAVDKKTPHKGDRQHKRMSDHSRVDDFFTTTSFTKTDADGIQIGRINMKTVNLDDCYTISMDISSISQVISDSCSLYDVINYSSYWQFFVRAAM